MLQIAGAPGHTLASLAPLLCLSLLLPACGGARPGLGVDCGECDDGNPCTEDSCDETAGACAHQPKAGPCDDGDQCTNADQCSDGACKAGAKVSCDDGNACTDDACSAKTGCANTANSAACDDSNTCTEGEICAAGSCMAGSEKACDDGNPCTKDTCGAATGCASTPATAACDDGNACTTKDACDAGSCAPGTAVDCDDGNGCTTDSCEPASGCAHIGLSSFPCDDGDECTEADACADGQCSAGTPKICADSDACTTALTCSGGQCGGGKAKDCDDQDACTVDTCDATAGCAHSGLTGPKCDDGNACTTGDTCAFGACKAAPLSCDDGNLCTNDSCSSKTGCVNAANSAPCDDGSKCTLSDTCSGGACKAGVNLGCELCGNGTIDGPTSAGPASCGAGKDPVKVSSAAELSTWAKTSNAPLVIVASIDLAGGKLNIDTPCTVEIAEKAGITGASDVLIATTDLRIAGELAADGIVVLRGSKKLEITGDASIGSDLKALSLESVKLSVQAGLPIGAGLCSDAGSVVIGGSTVISVDGAGAVGITATGDMQLAAQIKTTAAVTLKAAGTIKVSEGAVLDSKAALHVTADSVDFRGKALALASMHATALKALSIGSDAAVAATGDIQLTAGGALTLGGSLSKGGFVLIKAAALTMLPVASIKGGAGVDMLTTSPLAAELNGIVTGAGDVVVESGSLTLGKTADISNNKKVALKAADAIVINGQVSNNQAVSLVAKSVTVGLKDALSGNGNCAINATLGPGSEDSGCKSNAP